MSRKLRKFNLESYSFRGWILLSTAIGLPFLVVMLVVIGIEVPNWWGYFWLVAVAAANFWRLMWRCPSCGEYFGLTKSGGSQFTQKCLHCGHDIREKI